MKANQILWVVEMWVPEKTGNRGSYVPTVGVGVTKKQGMKELREFRNDFHDVFRLSPYVRAARKSKGKK